jgi:hypothetical protein
MNKACFVLIFAMSPASLFAGETMITQTVRTTTKCDFRVDKCETSVATDPSYVRFKDGTTRSGVVEVGTTTADPTFYLSFNTFQDYPAQQTPTVEELLALIRQKLSNCPDVEFTFDEDTGDLTLHYVNSTCDCNCDWTVNIRDVKANDFVWKRTTDNYSPRLGQMERRKFHTTSEKNAQDIESAFAQICAIKGWTIQSN